MTENRATRRRRRRPVQAVEPAPGRMAYTVNEAAWLLHCSPNHAWSLVGSGALPSFTLGRKRLISRGELEAFVANGGTKEAS